MDIFDSPYIVKTSSENGLELYSYAECSNNSPSDVKQCRGVVVEHGTKNILWKTFGYIDEFVDEMPDYDTSDYALYSAYEGTSLRLFHYNEKWILCTHRKLDAFKSRWSSTKSFGQLFVDALMTGYGLVYPEFLDTLDKTKLYMFFLRTSEHNRTVCLAGPYNELYHSATFDSTGLVDAEIGIRKQRALEIPESTDRAEHILSVVRKTDPMWSVGVILRKGMHEVKILNAEYAQMRDVRGNSPSLAFRYLEIRADVELYAPFMKLYWMYEPMFEEIEQNIRRVAERLCALFIVRYVRNHFEYLPTTEHLLLKNAYRRHGRIDDTESGRAELTKYFLYELSKLNPVFLCKLLYN